MPSNFRLGVLVIFVVVVVIIASNSRPTATYGTWPRKELFTKRAQKNANGMSETRIYMY